MPDGQVNVWKPIGRLTSQRTARMQAFSPYFDEIDGHLFQFNAGLFDKARPEAVAIFRVPGELLRKIFY